MSEIINLIPDNPDVHVYQKAVEILSDRIDEDYSFIINTWNGKNPDTTKYKRILISTSDENHQIPKESNDERYVYIFKQYAPMQNINDPNSVINIHNVSAIPLCHLNGVKSKNINIKNREFDWCWMGQFDQYKRAEFRVAINKLSRIRHFKNYVLWYNGWNNGISKTMYSDILNNTKIIFVPTGSASMESFRFFEAMMCGCIVVCIDMPRVDFYNTANIIKIDEWNNLENTVSYILSRNSEIEYISYEAMNWYKYYCSPDGLANYMEKILNV